jgi:hypothetical protein
MKRKMKEEEEIFSEDGLVYCFDLSTKTETKGTAVFDYIYPYEESLPIVTVFLKAHLGNNNNEDELIKDIIRTIVEEQLHFGGIWCEKLMALFLSPLFFFRAWDSASSADVLRRHNRRFKKGKNSSLRNKKRGESFTP